MNESELQEVNSWFEGKEFSTDWTSSHYPVWIEKLSDCKSKKIKILELGSWEGRSAIFFLEYLPLASITCVDTFTGGQEHLSDENYRILLNGVEQRFDNNVAGYAHRVTKIKSFTSVALARLVESQQLFDLIYIDASHQRDDVMIDSLLSWKLLKSNGILIWDDYGGGAQVKPAVDLFYTWHQSELYVKHVGYQIIVEKLVTGCDSEGK